MLAITWYDLRHRARQFSIAVIGAALVFAIGMLNAGLANTFHSEVARLTADAGADSWVVPAGSTGPLTSFNTLGESAVAEVRAAPGVTAAAPLVLILRETLLHRSSRTGCSVIGFVPGQLGDAAPARGRRAAKSGEAVVDARLGIAIGQSFVVSGRQFVAVGITHGRTLNAGIPVVRITIGDARQIAYGGQAEESTVLTTGMPRVLPASLHDLTPAQVRTDSLRPLKPSIAALDNTMELMWVIAAVIVAALLYVSALERVRDFAVLKAIGASNRSIFAGVALQAVIVTLAAAGVASAIANFLKPVFPLPVSIPLWAFLTLPAISVGVGVLSSLVALRRAVSVDPSLAFS